MNGKLYFAGSCKDDSNLIAYGVRLEIEGSDTPIQSFGLLGEGSSNIADWKALVMGLDIAVQNEVTNLIVYGSKVIIEQMKVIFKVRNPGLRSIQKTAVAISRKFKSVEYKEMGEEKGKVVAKLIEEAFAKQI